MRCFSKSSEAVKGQVQVKAVAWALLLRWLYLSKAPPLMPWLWLCVFPLVHLYVSAIAIRLTYPGYSASHMMINIRNRPRSNLEIGVVPNGDQFRPPNPYLISRCVSENDHYCVKTLSLGWLIMAHYFSNIWWICMASLNHKRKIFPWLQASVFTMKFGNHKIKELQPPSQCWDSYITKWSPDFARLNEFLAFWYTWKGTDYKPREWK